jgi:hypothetical protein
MSDAAGISEDKFATFPDDVQDLVDKAIKSLGEKRRLFRNPALNQLASWLEVEDHAVELVTCEWTWQNGATLDWLQNHLQQLSEEQWNVAPAERLAHMRSVMERTFEGDNDLLGDEYAVHIAVPIRARDGCTAVLGFCFAAGGWGVADPYDWDGVFARLEDYRAWLLEEHGLFTCAEQWDALSTEKKLKVWEE